MSPSISQGLKQQYDLQYEKSESIRIQRELQQKKLAEAESLAIKEASNFGTVFYCTTIPKTLVFHKGRVFMNIRTHDYDANNLQGTFVNSDFLRVKIYYKVKGPWISYSSSFSLIELNQKTGDIYESVNKIVSETKEGCRKVTGYDLVS